MTKVIELSGGHVARVSDEDYERLAGHRWRAVPGRNDTLYASRSTKIDRKWSIVYMHREVMGYGPGDPLVDHADGDGLNNTRENLRAATNSENGANARMRCDNASGYRGVSWHKCTGKWQAQIRNRGAKVPLGVYASPIEAALAFDRKARELFGEFARLNFPPGVPVPELERVAA